MIKALGDHIFIEKDPHGPTHEGGILIPESLERTPRFSPTVLATVVSVGAQVDALKPGDRIAVQNHAGDDWFVDGRKLTHLRAKHIVGRVET